MVLGYAAAAANYAAQLPDCRVLLFKGRSTPLILVDESTHRPAIGIFAMYDNWVVNLTVVTAAVGWVGVWGFWAVPGLVWMGLSSLL